MKSLDIHSEIEILRSAGTTQLRRIARLLKVKGASKLKRDELIFSIIGKQQEAVRLSALQLNAFSVKPPDNA